MKKSLISLLALAIAFVFGTATLAYAEGTPATPAGHHVTKTHKRVMKKKHHWKKHPKHHWKKKHHPKKDKK